MVHSTHSRASLTHALAFLASILPLTAHMPLSRYITAFNPLDRHILTKGRISLENTYGPSKPKYLRCALNYISRYWNSQHLPIESFMAYLYVKSPKFISVKGQLIDTSVLTKHPPTMALQTPCNDDIWVGTYMYTSKKNIL